MFRTKVCQLESEACLREAKAVIREGGVLVYPTDTLYGFGVDARNNSALKRLSKLKGREGPWSVTVSDKPMLRRYGEIPGERWDFIKSHLPGKVTFILLSRPSDLSPRVLGKNKTIGIRIPGHDFPVRLTRALRFPITSTSVNRTGEPPINDPESIVEVFGSEVDLIVDGGILSPSRGSRIYDLSGDEITVLRESE